MKFHPVLFLVFIAAIFIIITSSSAIPTCTFRSGSCNGGEVCTLSVYQDNDTHVGSCDAYNTKICCTEITSATLRSNACNSDEGGIASMYDTTNSHAAGPTYFNNVVCSKFTSNPLLARTRATCLAREACLASVYQQNDTHLGVCGYFGNSLCIQQNFNVTITVLLNNTNPNWNESVGVQGVASRADGSFIDTSSDPEEVQVYANSSLLCTTDTNSTGGYSCGFAAPSSLGLYSLNVTIVDPTTSLLHWNSTTFNVKTALGETNATKSSAGSIACYEEPRVIQNPDGTIEESIVTVCVWK